MILTMRSKIFLTRAQWNHCWGDTECNNRNMSGKNEAIKNQACVQKIY